MGAGKKNLTAEQGATFRLNFTLTNKATGIPWDLTSYIARMQIRPSAESSTVLLSLTNTSGITLGGSLGTVAIEVLNFNVAAGKYVYDFELESAGGEIWRVIEGKFLVKSNVTR